MDCIFIVSLFLFLAISFSKKFHLHSRALFWLRGKCESEWEWHWQWQCHDEFGSDKCRTPSESRKPGAMWKIPKSVLAIYAQVAENTKTMKKNSELNTERNAKYMHKEVYKGL